MERVINLCKELKVDINKNDIDRAHRVGKDRTTMIVKFPSPSVLLCINQEKMKKKNHLDIKKERFNLLDEAKKLINDDSKH